MPPPPEKQAEDGSEEQSTSGEDKLERVQRTKQFRSLTETYGDIAELKSADAFARRTALDKLLDKQLVAKLSQSEDFYALLGEVYQNESDPWNRRYLIRQLTMLVDNPAYHEVFSEHFLNALGDSSPIVRGEVAQCLAGVWEKLLGSPVEDNLLRAVLEVANKDEDELTKGYAISAVKKYAQAQKKVFVSLRHFEQSLGDGPLRS